jgi:predicted nucleotide-binding protein (sugar kinase/HSP70/actin superfamily)
VDLLGKLLRRFRPYAVRPTEAEDIYHRALKELMPAVASRQELQKILRRAAESFARIELREEERPRIGVVGEIFLRSTRFSNEDLVRQIERCGGEVVLASVSEWILYTNYCYVQRCFIQRQYRNLAQGWLRDRIQRRMEKKLVHEVEGYLQNGHEPSIKKLLQYSRPYLHPSFEGEAVLTLGKSVDFALHGISGVVSAMPFTCMPGTITAAISTRVREDYHSLPYLNMVYDGQGGSGAEVRLEPFLHQARNYQRRAAGRKSKQD